MKRLPENWGHITVSLLIRFWIYDKLWERSGTEYADERVQNLAKNAEGVCNNEERQK